MQQQDSCCRMWVSTVTHTALTFLGFRGKHWWNFCLKFSFVSEVQKRFYRGRISNIPPCPKLFTNNRNSWLKCRISFLCLDPSRILFHIPLMMDCPLVNQEIWVSNLHFFISACWITLWNSGEDKSSEVGQGQIFIKWHKKQSTSLEERDWTGPISRALSSFPGVMHNGDIRQRNSITSNQHDKYQVDPL